MKNTFVYRLWGHFKTITAHKLLVSAYCFKSGLIAQGIRHDLSKYMPVEFWAGVKYYQGNRSPIDKEKEINGYSMGWLHHKGTNLHHWEHWIDVDKNTHEIIVHPMKFNYIAESICDRVAACRIYQKEKYTQSSAYDYFINGIDRHLMHPETAKTYEKYLGLIKDLGEDKAFKILKEDVRQFKRSQKQNKRQIHH